MDDRNMKILFREALLKVQGKCKSTNQELHEAVFHHSTWQQVKGHITLLIDKNL